MAQFQLSSEESSLFEIMKVLREDNKVSLKNMDSIKRMAKLIPHTDSKTQTHFDNLVTAIQEGQRSTARRTSLSPEKKALWTEFAEIKVAPNKETYAAVCEAAAMLILNAWIDYPRPGTEQAYTPGDNNGNRKRRRVCDDSFQCAAMLVEKMAAAPAAPRMTQNQRWIYTLADLLDKLCW